MKKMLQMMIDRLDVAAEAFIDKGDSQNAVNVLEVKTQLVIKNEDGKRGRECQVNLGDAEENVQRTMTEHRLQNPVS